MRLARARLPEWYIADVPAFLARPGGELTPEDQATLLILWGAAMEAIRDGCDPVWLRADLARLIAEASGVERSVAYRRLQRLLHRRWKGKRLLAPVGSAPDGVSAGAGGPEGGSAPDGVSPSSGRGSNLLALGEAFEADLARARRLLHRCNSCTDAIPDDKRGTLGGGGYMHGLPDLKKPPPPPDLSCTDATLLHECNNVASVRQCGVDETTGPPALAAMARAIGVVRKAGFAAVAASGLGPRALWRLWAHRIEPAGGGVGALVAVLAEHGPEVRALVPDRWEARFYPLDPCPRCGGDLRGASGRWRDRCPACGAGIRECGCGELAPEEEPCPWCGAPPGPEPNREADPPDVEGEPNRLEEAWEAFIEALRVSFPDAPGRVRLQEARPEGDGWRLLVMVPADLALAIREAVAAAMSRILGVRVRVEIVEGGDDG